jgi:LAO/AO transport system kinase
MTAARPPGSVPLRFWMRCRLKSWRPGGHLIGITGPPGAGKSSLTASLIQVWRRRGLKVAILAVDPSSPISGGALLGDRLRMHASGADREVFIRSLACRGEFGGLSAEVWPMSLAMLAAFDIVLVETVGVGQKRSMCPR